MPDRTDNTNCDAAEPPGCSSHSQPLLGSWAGGLLLRASRAPSSISLGWLAAALLAGMVLQLGASNTSAHPEAVVNELPVGSAVTWLQHYQALAAEAPESCPPTTIPTLAPDVPARAFELEPSAAQPGSGPLIAALRDPIAERFLVLAEDADGCVQVGESGRGVPFDWRSVSSPVPNSLLPVSLGATPAVAIVADPKMIRPWIEVLPLDQFARTSHRDWILLGMFAGMLASFTVVAILIARSQRSPLIWAYLLYLGCLQFYQLQAFGLGPAWLPFWPPASASQLLQALATGTTMSSMTLVIFLFLQPRGWMRSALLACAGLSIGAFFLSAVHPSIYRFAAAALLVTAALVMMLLAQRLRTGRTPIRWFGLGLTAVVLAVGAQAVSAVTQAAWLPPQVGIATPFGNVIEAICWLLAIVSHVKAQHRSLLERQLSESRYDSLTDSYNRRYLRKRINLAIAEAKRTGSSTSGLLYIDLFGFKDIKDRFGQAIGDEALCGFVSILKEMRLNADAIGRYGGHEFVILMRQDAHWSDTEGAAATILSRFQEALELDKQSVLMRPDIGIVCIGAQYSDVDEVMEDASRALRISTQLGGRRATLFEPKMRDRAKVEQALLNALEEAIRNHQLDLYYQPTVALETMLPVGFEALLHCPHVTEQGVSVDQIFATAESAGMLKSLGERVIELALAQIAIWQRQGLWSTELFLSINVCQQQLIDEHFLESLHHASQHHNVDVSSIRLELSERSLGVDLDWSHHVLPRLLNRHVLLGIDNFGAGLASLTMLTDLQPDYIKIDKRLVAVLATLPRAQNLARAACLFTAETGGLAIAEGIETRMQLETLRELGVEYGQGRLIAAPMSGDEAGNWLQLATRAHELPRDDRSWQRHLH
ncbi:EAL domain-containing protein [Halochromatium sp.]